MTTESKEDVKVGGYLSGRLTAGGPVLSGRALGDRRGGPG